MAYAVDGIFQLLERRDLRQSQNSLSPQSSHGSVTRWHQVRPPELATSTRTIFLAKQAKIG